jgi:hypothetical protein
MLLLWLVGLSTANHLTALCELLICSYRRVDGPYVKSGVGYLDC